MSERRKETRRKLMAFTPVHDLHPRNLLGYLGDLTPQGALVIGKNPMTINRETTLEIEFPNDLPDLIETRITIPVRIARCQKDESSDYFNIGVEFTELTPEHAELIQEILARYHFQHVMPDIDFKGNKNFDE